jgi:hypothetical protein
VPTASGDCPTVVNTNHPAATPDFPEAHENPEQSAKIKYKKELQPLFNKRNELCFLKFLKTLAGRAWPALRTISFR